MEDVTNYIQKKTHLFDHLHFFKQNENEHFDLLNTNYIIAA